jgi:hypothetical protein
MSDISILVSTLDQKRQELARMEIELKQAQRQRLQNLAAEMGFQSTDELIQELAPFASPALAGAIRDLDGAQASNGKHLPRAPAGARKPRAMVNDETRHKLANELKAGRRTAAEIAKMFDVSSSLVNQLKGKLGLTRKRG